MQENEQDYTLCKGLIVGSFPLTGFQKDKPILAAQLDSDFGIS